MVREVDYAHNLNVIYSSFETKVTDGVFGVEMNKSQHWIHISMNYI